MTRPGHRPRHWPRLLVALALGGAVAGCALTDPPSAEQLRRDALPNLAVPNGWTGAAGVAAAGGPSGSPATASSASAEASGDRPADAGWLAAFGDPALVTLVAEALASNPDLAVAAARVDQAVANVRIANAALVPAVNGFARGGTKLAGDLTGLSGAGVTVLWELDVWGRVRYAGRAAQGVAVATQADYAYARQSVAAVVAKAWFQTIEATQQLVIARDTVQAAERLLSLASDRLRVGAGSELDVALARASVNALRDSARGIEAARLQSIRALETLLGRYPAASAPVPAKWAALPARSDRGLPAELLERRPDVLAAERRVAAAWDKVGEARAARLPRLSLAAGLSSISSDLFVLQDIENPAVSLGVNLLAPIFDGGALAGVQAMRTAEQRQAVADWARTALRAFSEVENALAAETSLEAREAILRAAVADSERALELQEARYRVGAADLRSVLQQQLALYANRMALLRVQAESRVQRVNLHLALGGDFAPDGQPVPGAFTSPAPIEASSPWSAGWVPADPRVPAEPGAAP
jgi:multidrug efflux system outer membrane protein